VLLGGLGAVLASYGVLLALTRQEPVELLELAAWLAAGVLVHDVVVAGVVVGATFLGGRLLPGPWRGPAVFAFLVWGGVTLMAVPVLGRFGARPDNATLLDRPYLLSWSVGTALGVAVVVVAGLIRARREDNG
jgi:hypothetical protein